MRKHKGGTSYYSTALERAAHNKRKREILGRFARALRLDETALLNSTPDKSPSQAAARKIQAPVRGRIARTKKKVIISSGMASLNEIEKALKFFPKKKLQEHDKLLVMNFL